MLAILAPKITRSFQASTPADAVPSAASTDSPRTGIFESSPGPGEQLLPEAALTKICRLPTRAANCAERPGTVWQQRALAVPQPSVNSTSCSPLWAVGVALRGRGRRGPACDPGRPRLVPQDPPTQSPTPAKSPRGWAVAGRHRSAGPLGSGQPPLGHPARTGFITIFTFPGGITL